MPEPVNTRFTIRVYGILLNERQEVLLSDESYMGYRFTKFPGGGLEYGEGTVDCLKREIREETGLEVTDLRLRGVVNVCPSPDGVGVFLFVFKIGRAHV